MKRNKIAFISFLKIGIIVLISIAWITNAQNISFQPTFSPTSIYPNSTQNALNITYSLQPSSSPSMQPYSIPSMQPTDPSQFPTSCPSIQPTEQPSILPTIQPWIIPSTQPSSRPTTQPSHSQSAAPSCQPSNLPTTAPSNQPSSQPSALPSAALSSVPSCQPTSCPSIQPSLQSSSHPTVIPTNQPSNCPTAQPFFQPSSFPTSQPSSRPSCSPTCPPTNQPSSQPLAAPSSEPTLQPTSLPTSQPLGEPTCNPTVQPSSEPTSTPSSQPSSEPSYAPSSQPTTEPSQPSSQPSSFPSFQPSSSPSMQPTSMPSSLPTQQPQCYPSNQPSIQPASNPTYQPSTQPSEAPSSEPSTIPSDQPTSQPTIKPTQRPVIPPTTQPTIEPTDTPSQQPQSRPTSNPTQQPFLIPSLHPRSSPSSQPSRQPTENPTHQPTSQPILRPTSKPSKCPSSKPTEQPIFSPSSQPTSHPSSYPTNQPSTQPSIHPTDQPSQQPSFYPSMQPSIQPSQQPSKKPTSQPTSRPSMQPSSQPSQRPSFQPSSQPSTQPSANPTSQSTGLPTTQPSYCPTTQPSSSPTVQPTQSPTNQPSLKPSMQPTRQPSVQPTKQPSQQPTTSTTSKPSNQPTSRPSTQPSSQPSSTPSVNPTRLPTFQPTRVPSGQPSITPSNQPSRQPLVDPSSQPSNQPSNQPTTQPTSMPTNSLKEKPTSFPTKQPSSFPTDQPTRQPSIQPTKQPSSQPSSLPTIQPLINPSLQPSPRPTTQPTCFPSVVPSELPTIQPTRQPTCKPSLQPSVRPSRQPSCQPSRQPTSKPSHFPSRQPSQQPTAQPSRTPSTSPSIQPTRQPSRHPSRQPSNQPSSQPSRQPTRPPTSQSTTQPTLQPTNNPSTLPTVQPTLQPTDSPSVEPTVLPTSQPSNQPSNQPSKSQSNFAPTSQPSEEPSAVPSSHPSYMSSSQPTSCPSLRPLTKPSSQPSVFPSTQPKSLPSTFPSRQPSRQPTAQPSRQPSRRPSCQPSCQPSLQPICKPSVQPSSKPSRQPSHCPTKQPSNRPTRQPSRQPTNEPSRKPSSTPTGQPYSKPSLQPIGHPSHQPTATPSRNPTNSGSISPTGMPTNQPSVWPTDSPSATPTSQPSNRPTQQGTSNPTSQPTGLPSLQPFNNPSVQPSSSPSDQPTCQPSDQPTSKPSHKPSTRPSAKPSKRPSHQPSNQPSHQPTTQPSNQPTNIPTRQPSRQPSKQPHSKPSHTPSSQPTGTPSHCPSGGPTIVPSTQPTSSPTAAPSSRPFSRPTVNPSDQPSVSPSGSPSNQPTAKPSIQPSVSPTKPPSSQPTNNPSRRPTSQPTNSPSTQPTHCPRSNPSAQPTRDPTDQPTSTPSTQPSAVPARLPTMQPSGQVTNQPSSQPSSRPSRTPSHQPSRKPSSQPTTKPSSRPTRQPTLFPTSLPSVQPSSNPSNPSTQPSSQPTSHPTTSQPSSQPSRIPSRQPSVQPTKQPTVLPSSKPSSSPSANPTNPSSVPTTRPTNRPSDKPSSSPTFSLQIQVSYQAVMLLGGVTQTAYISAGNSSAVLSAAIVQVVNNLRTDDIVIGNVMNVQYATPSITPSVVSKQSVRGLMDSRKLFILQSPVQQPVINVTFQLSFFTQQILHNSEPSQARHAVSSQINSSFINGNFTNKFRKVSHLAGNSALLSAIALHYYELGNYTAVISKSAKPTMHPSSHSTRQPSSQPSRYPSSQPSLTPSSMPSSRPSVVPTSSPTDSVAEEWILKFDDVIDSVSIQPFTNAYRLLYYELIVQNSTIYGSCSSWNNFWSTEVVNAMAAKAVQSTTISHVGKITNNSTNLMCNDSNIASSIVSKLVEYQSLAPSLVLQTYQSLSPVQFICQNRSWILQMCHNIGTKQIETFSVGLCVDCANPCALSTSQSECKVKQNQFSIAPCTYPSISCSPATGLFNILTIHTKDSNGGGYGYTLSSYSCIWVFVIGCIYLFQRKSDKDLKKFQIKALDGGVVENQGGSPDHWHATKVAPDEIGPAQMNEKETKITTNSPAAPPIYNRAMSLDNPFLPMSQWDASSKSTDVIVYQNSNQHDLETEVQERSTQGSDDLKNEEVIVSTSSLMLLRQDQSNRTPLKSILRNKNIVQNNQKETTDGSNPATERNLENLLQLMIITAFEDLSMLIPNFLSFKTINASVEGVREEMIRKVEYLRLLLQSYHTYGLPLQRHEHPLYRIGYGLNVISRMSWIFFLVAAFISLQYPNDDGTCYGMRSRSDCLDRKLPLNSDESYCDWFSPLNVIPSSSSGAIKTNNVVGSQFIYQPPCAWTYYNHTISYHTSMSIIIVTLLLLVIIRQVCEQGLIKQILLSPNSRQADSNGYIAQYPFWKDHFIRELNKLQTFIQTIWTRPEVNSEVQKTFSRRRSSRSRTGNKVSAASQDHPELSNSIEESRSDVRSSQSKSSKVTPQRTAQLHPSRSGVGRKEETPEDNEGIGMPQLQQDSDILYNVVAEDSFVIEWSGSSHEQKMDSKLTKLGRPTSTNADGRSGQALVNQLGKPSAIRTETSSGPKSPRQQSRGASHGDAVYQEDEINMRKRSHSESSDDVHSRKRYQSADGKDGFDIDPLGHHSPRRNSRLKADDIRGNSQNTNRSDKKSQSIENKNSPKRLSKEYITLDRYDFITPQPVTPHSSVLTSIRSSKKISPDGPSVRKDGSSTKKKLKQSSTAPVMAPIHSNDPKYQRFRTLYSNVANMKENQLFMQLCREMHSYRQTMIHEDDSRDEVDEFDQEWMKWNKFLINHNEERIIWAKWLSIHKISPTYKESLDDAHRFSVIRTVRQPLFPTKKEILVAELDAIKRLSDETVHCLSREEYSRSIRHEWHMMTSDIDDFHAFDKDFKLTHLLISDILGRQSIPSRIWTHIGQDKVFIREQYLFTELSYWLVKVPLVVLIIAMNLLLLYGAVVYMSNQSLGRQLNWITTSLLIVLIDIFVVECFEVIWFHYIVPVSSYHDITRAQQFILKHLLRRDGHTAGSSATISSGWNLLPYQFISINAAKSFPNLPVSHTILTFHSLYPISLTSDVWPSDPSPIRRIFHILSGLLFDCSLSTARHVIWQSLRWLLTFPRYIQSVEVTCLICFVLWLISLVDKESTGIGLTFLVYFVVVGIWLGFFIFELHVNFPAKMHLLGETLLNWTALSPVQSVRVQDMKDDDHAARIGENGLDDQGDDDHGRSMKVRGLSAGYHDIEIEDEQKSNKSVVNEPQVWSGLDQCSIPISDFEDEDENYLNYTESQHPWNRQNSIDLNDELPFDRFPYWNGDDDVNQLGDNTPFVMDGKVGLLDGEDSIYEYSRKNEDDHAVQVVNIKKSRPSSNLSPVAHHHHHPKRPNRSAQHNRFNSDALQRLFTNK